MAQTEYISGVCNIGPEETKRRRNLGWISLVIAIVFLLLLIWTNTNPLWHLFVFFPAAMSASGFLQAHFHFCSGFARKGIFNFDSPGNSHEVSDEQSRLADKKRGNQITQYALIIGLVVSIIAVLI